MMHHKQILIALAFFLASSLLTLGINTDALGGHTLALTSTHGLLATSSDEIENPLGFNNLSDLLRRIGTVLLEIGVPLAAVMIAWGGWLRVTAGGDTEQVTRSNNTIKYAVIGLVILLMAQGIVSLVQDILKVKSGP